MNWQTGKRWERDEESSAIPMLIEDQATVTARVQRTCDAFWQRLEMAADFEKRTKREVKPRCPHCLHLGYDEIEPSAKNYPQFKCQRCGHIWTDGPTGGKYKRSPTG